jgi:hypothetical protein
MLGGMKTLLMLVVMVSSVGCAFLNTTSHERNLLGTYEYKKEDELFKIVLSRDFFYSDSLSEFLGLDFLLHGELNLFGQGPNHAIISERSNDLLELYKDDDFLSVAYEKGELNEHESWRFNESDKTLAVDSGNLNLFGPMRIFIINSDGSLTEYQSRTGGLFSGGLKSIPESKRRTLVKIE